MNVDRACATSVSVAPDIGEQEVSGQDTPVMLHQVFEQQELFGRQMYRRGRQP